MPPTADQSLNLPKQALRRAERQLLLDRENEHFHPLEAIHFFRRWKRSFVRNLVYTLIFNLFFAVCFTTMALLFTRVGSIGKLWAIFTNNLIISNAVGFMFWAVFSLIGPLLRKINLQPFIVVTLMYTVIGTVIVSVTFLIMVQFAAFEAMRSWAFTPQQIGSSFLISLFVSLVLTIIWRRRVDELAAHVVLAEERGRVEAAERAVAQANLRALQAQIEPHFLFNTLANVVGLIHPQPATAKLMLEEFIAYLRTSLANTREQETTIGREFALMRSFLAILQVRMGDRLQVNIDCPPTLADVILPPMLLQPLVENAIKHGLEPKVEGGGIALSATREGEQLKISVVDTGVGFGGGTLGGIGLKNVRERVEQLYAGEGSVVIEENQPAGTRVVLILPLHANAH